MLSLLFCKTFDCVYIVIVHERKHTLGTKRGRGRGRGRGGEGVRESGRSVLWSEKHAAAAQGRAHLVRAAARGAHTQAGGKAHKAAEPEEHARRTRSCPRPAAAPRLLSVSLCRRETRHRGGQRNMTEVGKKRLLVLVDVLCVFVGEWSALVVAAAVALGLFSPGAAWLQAKPELTTFIVVLLIVLLSTLNRY